MTISERWRIEDIENEIISYLTSGKKVFIESGCLNDNIISYSINKELKEREVTFTTSACVFSKQINLMGNYSNIDIEEYEGNLFVKVL